MAPPTIISLKANFLADQTRLLSQPLTPSHSWRNVNEEAEDGVSEKAVDDALFRLNHVLQQHARRVYAPQATRHVAEQIDQLYWNAGSRAVESSRDAGAERLDISIDLSMPQVSFPPFPVISLQLTGSTKRTPKLSTPSRPPGSRSGT